MSATALPAHQLRLSIAPDSLGFVDTSELQDLALPWIGQERAEAAARFGLAMQQPDYHLFVLGETGSGRSSLLRQAMADLCDALEADIPKRLSSPDVRAEAERIEKAYQRDEGQAFAALDAFAEARHFRLSRDTGHLVFTLLGANGQPYTEDEARALSREQRASIDQAEQELRSEITRFIDQVRPLEQRRDEALATLRRKTIKPLIEQGLQSIRQDLKKQIKDAVKLGQWLDQVETELLDNLTLFEPSDPEQASLEAERKELLDDLLSRCHVNLVVDNDGRTSAPVIVEDNPQLRSLFGSVEYQAESDMLLADFSCIHAGSLLKAHGGFLMLHLRDLLGDEGLWERLRRFLRCNRLQIEEPGASHGGMATVALQPEAVEVDVKLVLIGSVEEYYALQEGDPETARRFRVKVDFAEHFIATEGTRHATAVFVAHTCQKRGLPHFTAAAVARLLEESHRAADDQGRQSAVFGHTETLLIESAEHCRARGGPWVEVADVEAARQARRLRHNHPEEEMHATLTEGERLISLQGAVVGQINGLTQIDLGDYRFGFPARITARTYAGRQGLINIEREVDMSGPIHDKGVLILHSYLTALFGHLAPLALNASIVFEQEYMGIEGDSASCAELYALLSSLSGLPLRQGIAVTGALNQLGEVLPVGGINEKIEGWFQACEAAGLDGTQGVLIPARNRRHLMLDHRVVEAVEAGQFHVHTATHIGEGIALLTGTECPSAPPGLAGIAALPGEVIERAEAQLRAYRKACQVADGGRRGRRRGGLRGDGK